MSNPKNVSYGNKNFYRKDKKDKVDSEKLASFLKDAVQKVRTQEDPLALNEYRSVFKKNVPLTMRMYVAAYLASQAASRERGSRYGYENRDSRFSHDNRERKTEYKSESVENTFENSEERPRPPRVVIPEDQATTIFVGIGKNRHVKPKDLVGLISQVCELSRDRIGLIRTLDKFSFVSLYTEDADMVIEKLNGISYRGKNIEVSYSRKRSSELNSEDSSDVAEENDSDESVVSSSDNANTEISQENE